MHDLMLKWQQSIKPVLKLHVLNDSALNVDCRCWHDVMFHSSFFRAIPTKDCALLNNFFIITTLDCCFKIVNQTYPYGSIQKYYALILGLHWKFVLLHLHLSQSGYKVGYIISLPHTFEITCSFSETSQNPIIIYQGIRGTTKYFSKKSAKKIMCGSWWIRL